MPSVRTRSLYPVGFISCDAAVHGNGTVADIKQARGLMGGGGGSDSRPAFDAIAARKDRPGVVVFVTDGFLAFPEEAPRGFRTVWVLMGPHVSDPPWGEVIRVAA